MPPKPTLASRARELHAAEPGLTHAEIARRLSTPRRTVSRQLVRSALVAPPTGRRRRPGPKPPTTGTAELRIRLDAPILQQARARAELEDCDLAYWIEGCILACEQDAEMQSAARARARGGDRAGVGVR